MEEPTASPISRRRSPGPNPAAPDVVSSPVIAAADPQLVVGRARGAATTADRTPDFDQLFDLHYERLVRALAVVAGDVEAAADAVQEAFVKAHLRWRRISRYDDPIGWIRRVAINGLRDEHRRRGRKERAVQRLASRPAMHVDPPESDDLGVLLRSLPRQQRIVTALFYVDDLTVAEIAAVLDLAEGTVKSHLHDARRHLRSVIGEEERSGG